MWWQCDFLCAKLKAKSFLPGAVCFLSLDVLVKKERKKGETEFAFVGKKNRYVMNRVFAE